MWQVTRCELCDEHKPLLASIICKPKLSLLIAADNEVRRFNSNLRFKGGATSLIIWESSWQRISIFTYSSNNLMKSLAKSSASNISNPWRHNRHNTMSEIIHTNAYQRPVSGVAMLIHEITNMTALAKATVPTFSKNISSFCICICDSSLTDVCLKSCQHQIRVFCLVFCSARQHTQINLCQMRGKENGLGG